MRVVTVVLVLLLLACPSVGRVVADSAPPGTILLSDDFTDPDTGQLPNDSPDPDQWMRYYDNGEYDLQRVDPSLGRNVVATIGGGQFSDTTTDVTARIVGDSANRQVELSCRFQENDSSQSRFSVEPGNRSFTLARWDGSTEHKLAGFDFNSAIHGGNEPNQLELTCAGSIISAKVNGVQVVTVTDTTYSSGTLRLGVGDFAGMTEPVEARFSSLSVLQAAIPSSASVAPAAPTAGVAQSPSASPGAGPQLVASDDFSNPAMGLFPTGQSGTGGVPRNPESPSGSSSYEWPWDYGYANGALVGHLGFVLPNAPSGAIFGTHAMSSVAVNGDFAVAVQMVVTRSIPEAEGGIAFDPPGLPEYRVTIWPSQRGYTVWANQGGPPFVRGSSPAIAAGGDPNLLRIEVRGGTLTVFANGQQLGVVPQAGFSGRPVQIGLGWYLGGEPSDGTAEVMFQNFKVYAL